MGYLKSFFPILLAIVISLAGSYIIYTWIQKQTAPREVVTVENSEAVPVAVARIDIPWGTKIDPDMLQLTPFFKESLPSGYVSTPEDLDGRIVIAPLKKGDPVVEHRLAPTSIQTGGVAAILDPGKRAIAVQGDKVIGLSGFINPGNRVDVLVTIKDPGSQMEKTKTVLENILVLASGTQIEQQAKGEPAPVDVYTLEVTSEEGERLALASAKGKLQFALRGTNDYSGVLTTGVTIPQMLTSLSIPAGKTALPTVSTHTPATAPAKTKECKLQKASKIETRPTSRQRGKAVVEIIKGLELTSQDYLL